MKRLWLIVFCFWLAGGCEEPQDEPGIYFLSPGQKRFLPDTYHEGDTLAFLYTDPQGSDTQYYVVGKMINHITSYFMPKYGLMGKYETLELPLVPLGNYADLTLAVGNVSDNDYGGMWFSVGGGLVPLGLMREEPMDTTYRLRSPLNWYTTDTSLLTYSPYDGIKRIEHSKYGSRLERIK